MEPKFALAPHCATTEKMVLGVILQTQGSCLDEFPLTEEFFYTLPARTVFAAMMRLRSAGKSLNEFSLKAEVGAEAIGQMGEAVFYGMCSWVTPAYMQGGYQTLCEKLTLRRAQELGRWLVSESMESPDISQFCANAVHRANELEVAAQSDNVLIPAVQQAYEKLDRMDRGDKPKRRNTPIQAWNRIFGGIADERYYAIASRPGLGKTAMMEQMVTTYLQMDETVVVFEKDMSPQMLVERIACREAKVPFWRYERETLEAHERKNVRVMLSGLDPNRLKLFNPIGLTAEKLCAIARREIRQHKARAIFLDHIQCLRWPGRDLREGLTSSSLALRNNVTETGVSHIVLAHINREGAKGRPQPENIKEFDQLFGDVDALALLWSDVEAQDAKDERPMKLYAAKNRGGAVVEENLTYNGPLLTFT